MSESKPAPRIQIETYQAPGHKIDVRVNPPPPSALQDEVYDYLTELETSVPLVAALQPSPAPHRLAAALTALRRWLRLPAWTASPEQIANLLFIAGIFIYLLTRLVNLTGFPAYFASDEAVTSMRASDFVRDGLRDFQGRLFPTFFLNDDKFNLGTSVYLQILPRMLFGASTWAARVVPVLVCLLGVIWFALILRDIFHTRWWWAGTFIFSSVPVYFLFSRTLFETVLMVAFYTGAFYYYLRYRQGNFRSVYPAVILAAIAFYTYVPGQVMVVASAALFLLVDFRHHWQHRKALLPALGVGLLAALPFLRFWLTDSGQYFGAMQRYHSYITQDISIWEKLLIFLKNYFTALSPFYWFLPRQVDDIRFVMKGYGHIAWFLFPFAVIGLIYLLRRIRLPHARAVFVPLLAAPLAASLVFIEVTRVLLIILPYTLMICLGLFASLDRLMLRYPLRRLAIARWLTAGLAAFFTIFSCWMLVDASLNGPRWYPVYGLNGQQYGAPQVFPAAGFYAYSHPGVQVYVSGGWIWQGDVVMRFFLGDNPDVHMGQPNDRLVDLAAGKPLRFILKPEEYRSALDSGNYMNPKIERTILCPDGSPCFYLVNLELTPETRQQVLKLEREKDLPLHENLVLDGQTLATFHSALDNNPLTNLFDGKADTLLRTRVDNPFFIEITFPEPRSISGIEVLVGAEALRATVIVGTGTGERPEFSALAGPTKDLKIIPLNFGSNLQVTFLRLEVFSPNDGAPANIHVRDVRFLP